ncbi:MAG: signal peptidase I [Isosphaeraceae bacterium]
MDRASADESPRRWGRSRRGRWVTLVLLLVLGGGLGWAVVSNAMTVRVYSIPTGSMAPALMPGDRVSVQTRPGRAPRRGEIWVARLPRASGGSGEVVKRVVGLPGETVEVRSGQVFIDGHPLDEPYLTAAIRYTMPPTTLGRGEYLLLGDQRNTSFDGHVWGPLPESLLVGPVLSRYWPVERIGGL